MGDFFTNATQHPEDTGVGYLRRTIDWNTPGLVAAAAGIGTAIPIGALPSGAMPIGVDCDIETAFNGAGVDELDVGVTGTLDGLAVDAGTAAAVAGFKPNLQGALSGIPVLVDTVVYVTYTWSVGAPTAGKAHFVVKFVPKRGKTGTTFPGAN